MLEITEDKLLEANKWRERVGKLMRVQFDPPLWKFINSLKKSAYLRGPNSGGKSYALAFFIAQILLGRYHPEYKGWKPVKAPDDTFAVIVWALSKTSAVLRVGLQKHLLGGEGTGGLIPAESIVKIFNSRGIAGAIDYVVIKRDDGTLAKLSFLSYDQGRQSLQAERVSVVAADEIFDDTGMLAELMARLAGVQGIFRLTATERLQQSEVAQYFYDGGDDREIVAFGLNEISRMDEAEKREIYNSYPEGPERESRYHGLPFRGGGGAFHTDVEDVIEDIDPSKFGPQVKYFISIDPSHFGQSSQASKFAALFWAYDPLRPNRWMIFDEILMRGSINDQVGAILAHGGAGIPIAWPHDGQQGTATGKSIADMFRSFPGIRMHHTWSTMNADLKAGYNLEDRLALCNQMLASQQIVISKSCRHFIQQYQSLERDEDDNKPLIEKLDLCSAFSIGIMMLKIARADRELWQEHGGGMRIEQPNRPALWGE